MLFRSVLQLMSEAEPGSRRSPGGAVLMSEMEPGSRRSPGGTVQQLMSEAEPGSRRSPGGAVQQLMSEAEPGSRRSPGGAVLFRRRFRWGFWLWVFYTQHQSPYFRV